MRKNKTIVVLTIMLCTALLSNDVYADDKIVEEEVVVSVESTSKDSEYEFVETPQEIIDEMKKNLEGYQAEEKISYLQNKASYTSGMARAFDITGFNHIADALDYSMLPMREEPRIFTRTSFLSQDIWKYSPDFEKVVVEFLMEARLNNSYEYFKTTNMEFQMPSDSEAKILADKALKKQTDIFAVFHGVTINLGVINDGFRWHVLVLIDDTFDFKYEEYKGMLGLVNNIAYYEQELGIVNPYKIMLNADNPNLIGLPFGVLEW